MISPLTTLKKSLINIQTGVLNFPDCDMNEIVSFTGDRVDEVVKRLGPGAIVSHDRFEQDGCSESIKYRYNPFSGTLGMDWDFGDLRFSQTVAWDPPGLSNVTQYTVIKKSLSLYLNALQDIVDQRTLQELIQALPIVFNKGKELDWDDIAIFESEQPYSHYCDELLARLNPRARQKLIRQSYLAENALLFGLTAGFPARTFQEKLEIIEALLTNADLLDDIDRLDENDFAMPPNWKHGVSFEALARAGLRIYSGFEDCFIGCIPSEANKVPRVFVGHKQQAQTIDDLTFLPAIIQMNIRALLYRDGIIEHDGDVIDRPFVAPQYPVRKTAFIN